MYIIFNSVLLYTTLKIKYTKLMNCIMFNIFIYLLNNVQIYYKNVEQIQFNIFLGVPKPMFFHI